MEPVTILATIAGALALAVAVAVIRPTADRRQRWRHDWAQRRAERRLRALGRAYRESKARRERERLGFDRKRFTVPWLW